MLDINMRAPARNSLAPASELRLNKLTGTRNEQSAVMSLNANPNMLG
jgi:hypothetical protein